MRKNRVSSISKADTLEKMGEFWETHALTDFDTDTPDVEFSISSHIAIDPDLLKVLHT